MSHSHTRRFLLALGAVGILAGALLAWVGINAPNSIPGRSYYTLKAELDEADNLTAHSQVRIAGRLVGQVLGGDVRNGKAVVELQLEGGLAPLRSDTTLRVRPRSPIGVRFVELVPGRRGRPLREGDTIPASQTSAALPLDTVLGTLDAPTRRRTRDLLVALGTGIAGRGEDAGEAVAAAPRMLREARAVSRAIAARTGAVAGLVRGGAAAAKAADPVRDDIAGGLRPGARALRPLHDARDALGETLDTAPAALPATERALAVTSPLLRETAGLAREALPMLRRAPRSLAATAALLRDGREAIGGLNRTLHLAEAAVDPTVDLVELLDGVRPKVDGAARGVTPILQELGPRRCDLVLMLRNFESMLAWGTPAGNFLRLNLLQSPESIAGQQRKGAILPAGVHSSPYPAPCAVQRDRERLGARR